MATTNEGKETLPAPLPTVDVYIGYLARGKRFAVEVLARGGMYASKGTTVTAKLKKYFLVTTGKTDLKEITTGQWEAAWATLDALAKDGNDIAVAEIETTIADKPISLDQKGKETLPDLAEVVNPETQYLPADDKLLLLSSIKALNELASIKPEELDDDDLGRILENAMGFAFCTLRMCKPLIEEMRARFKARPKNGPPIRGCTSFQEWCRKVLHRSEQAVYQLLREKQIEPEPEPEPEPVAFTPVPAEHVAELLDIFGEKIPVVGLHRSDWGQEVVTWTADSKVPTVDGHGHGFSAVSSKVIPPELYSHIAVAGCVNTYLSSLLRHLTKEERKRVLEELIDFWSRWARLLKIGRDVGNRL